MKSAKLKHCQAVEPLSVPVPRNKKGKELAQRKMSIFVPSQQGDPANEMREPDNVEFDFRKN